MIKLYYYPGACSLAPHIVLRELGLDFELVAVDLATKTTRDGADFIHINPKGQVPALMLEDGSVLTEVPAIVQYLADRRPDLNLAPAPATLARNRLQEWLNFVTAELHKGLSPLFYTDLPEAARGFVIDHIAGKFDYLDRHLARNDFLLDAASAWPTAMRSRSSTGRICSTSTLPAGSTCHATWTASRPAPACAIRCKPRD